MPIPAYVSDFQSFGYHTESSGTVITENIGAGKSADHRIGIINMAYTGTGTAHTIRLMYAEGTGSRNTADGSAASGQKKLNVDDDPKDPAGNDAAADDIIAYVTEDGTWEFNTVASISSKEITLSTNIATKVLDGAKVNIIGASGDGASLQASAAASSQKTWGDGELVFIAPYKGEPLHFNSDNSTNDGSIDYLVAVFMDK